jgi:hypothetical protein
VKNQSSFRMPQLHAEADDDLLAFLYISMWELASGRELPRGVTVGELSTDELIEFWADDLVAGSGRIEVKPRGKHHRR